MPSEYKPNIYSVITSNPYPFGPEAGDGEPASLSYTPDRLPSGFRRLWITGEHFQIAPPFDLVARIETTATGRLLDFYQMPLCVISLTLKQFFDEAGIDNIDYYPVKIVDETTGFVREDFIAFNIVGLIDLDLNRPHHVGNQGLKLFRLAESPDQIVVHESIRTLAEMRGITSLIFLHKKSIPTF